MSKEALKVVFTGPAVLKDNTTVTRDALTKASIAAGLVVQPGINAQTELLVASRTDTVKAQRAKQRGIRVIGYDLFVDRYLPDADLGGGKINLYTDGGKLDPELLIPNFLTQHELELLDQL